MTITRHFWMASRLTRPSSWRRHAGCGRVDAVHLATAVAAGADRFATSNARHFPKTIAEIGVTYPTDLPVA